MGLTTSHLWVIPVSEKFLSFQGEGGEGQTGVDGLMAKFK